MSNEIVFSTGYSIHVRNAYKRYISALRHKENMFRRLEREDKSITLASLKDAARVINAAYIEFANTCENEHKYPLGVVDELSKEIY
jgi:hypothetical protein